MKLKYMGKEKLVAPKPLEKKIKRLKRLSKQHNLVKYYTGSSPGIYACGDPSGGGTGNWSTSYESVKQELMNGMFVHKL